ACPVVTPLGPCLEEKHSIHSRPWLRCLGAGEAATAMVGHVGSDASTASSASNASTSSSAARLHRLGTGHSSSGGAAPDGLNLGRSGPPGLFRAVAHLSLAAATGAGTVGPPTLAAPFRARPPDPWTPRRLPPAPTRRPPVRRQPPLALGRPQRLWRARPAALAAGAVPASSWPPPAAAIRQGAAAAGACFGQCAAAAAAGPLPAQPPPPPLARSAPTSRGVTAAAATSSPAAGGGPWRAGLPALAADAGGSREAAAAALAPAGEGPALAAAADANIAAAAAAEACSPLAAAAAEVAAASAAAVVCDDEEDLEDEGVRIEMQGAGKYFGRAVYAAAWGQMHGGAVAAWMQGASARRRWAPDTNAEWDLLRYCTSFAEAHRFLRFLVNGLPRSARRRTGALGPLPSCYICAPGPPLAPGSTQVHLFQALLCPWVRWVYFNGRWRVCCEPCQKEVHDKGHFASPDHLDELARHRIDGLPDPKTYTCGGHFWSRLAGGKQDEASGQIVERSRWPGWKLTEAAIVDGYWHIWGIRFPDALARISAGCPLPMMDRGYACPPGAVVDPAARARSRPSRSPGPLTWAGSHAQSSPDAPQLADALEIQQLFRHLASHPAVRMLARVPVCRIPGAVDPPPEWPCALRDRDTSLGKASDPICRVDRAPSELQYWKLHHAISDINMRSHEPRGPCGAPVAALTFTLGFRSAEVADKQAANKEKGLFEDNVGFPHASVRFARRERVDRELVHLAPEGRCQTARGAYPPEHGGNTVFNSYKKQLLQRACAVFATHEAAAELGGKDLAHRQLEYLAGVLMVRAEDLRDDCDGLHPHVQNTHVNDGRRTLLVDNKWYELTSLLAEGCASIPEAALTVDLVRALLPTLEDGLTVKVAVPYRLQKGILKHVLPLSPLARQIAMRDDKNTDGPDSDNRPPWGRSPAASVQASARADPVPSPMGPDGAPERQGLWVRFRPRPGRGPGGRPELPTAPSFDPVHDLASRAPPGPDTLAAGGADEAEVKIDQAVAKMGEERAESFNAHFSLPPDDDFRWGDHGRQLGDPGHGHSEESSLGLHPAGLDIEASDDVDNIKQDISDMQKKDEELEQSIKELRNLITNLSQKAPVKSYPGVYERGNRDQQVIATCLKKAQDEEYAIRQELTADVRGAIRAMKTDKTCSDDGIVAEMPKESGVDVQAGEVLKLGQRRLSRCSCSAGFEVLGAIVSVNGSARAEFAGRIRVARAKYQSFRSLLQTRAASEMKRLLLFDSAVSKSAPRCAEPWELTVAQARKLRSTQRCECQFPAIPAAAEICEPVFEIFREAVGRPVARPAAPACSRPATPSCPDCARGGAPLEGPPSSGGALSIEISVKLDFVLFTLGFLAGVVPVVIARLDDQSGELLDEEVPRGREGQPLAASDEAGGVDEQDCEPRDAPRPAAMGGSRSSGASSGSEALAAWQGPFVPPAWDPCWASPASTLPKGGNLTARRAPQDWATSTLLMSQRLPAAADAAGDQQGAEGQKDPPASARGPREQPRAAKVPLGSRPRPEALAVASIPGYGGHLPGLAAGNVCGLSHRLGNVEALKRERGAAASVSRAWTAAATPGAGAPRALTEPRLGARRQLASLPGYAGHVPGRVAEHPFGASFRRENVMCLEVGDGGLVLLALGLVDGGSPPPPA
ncbi:unnamed protein product, partial [Prorocentrum cordatum]